MTDSPAARAPASGGPGWHIDAETLLPVLDDEAEFRRVHAKDPALEGIVALWGGRAAEAEALFAALAARDRSPRWRALRADAWRDLGRHDEAIDEYRDLVAHYAGTAREAGFVQHLGKALFAARRDAEAAEEFERAVELRRAALGDGADPDPSLLASSEQALRLARERAARSTAPADVALRIRRLTCLNWDGVDDRLAWGIVRAYREDTAQLGGDPDQHERGFRDWLDGAMRTGDMEYVLLLAEDGEIVSLARTHADEYPGMLLIEALQTAPEHRRRGHARTVIDAIVAVADLPLAAEVHPDNVASAATFRAAGFRPEASDRAYRTRWVRAPSG